MTRLIFSIFAAAAVLFGIAIPASAGEPKSQAKTSKYLKVELKDAVVVDVPPASASTQKGQIAGSLRKQQQGKTSGTDDWIGKR